jgi:hypothetical protein
MNEKETSRMCEIYCPSCEKVTDKISITLLKETGKVKASCPVCCNVTLLEYDDDGVTVTHLEDLSFMQKRR